jgi:hypothetical protein
MQKVAKKEGKEVQVVPSIPAGKNSDEDICAVCNDKFEYFFNDETEEWHLCGAVSVDGKAFHLICYDDYKVSIFFVMLCLLLEMLFCHFDKMLVLTTWLNGPLGILTFMP